MNTRKRIVKIAYGLDAALIIVLVGLVVYQHRLIQQMSDDEQQMSVTTAISDSNTLAKNNTQTIPVDEGDVNQLAAKVETLRYQLESAEEELEAAREDLADTKTQGEEWPEILKQSIVWENKIRENPILMKAKRRVAERMIVGEYWALFESLGVPDEKLQDIKAVMVDNDIEMEYLGMYAGGRLPPWTDEDREELLQQLEEQDTGFKEQMRALLGEENYEIYSHYVETRLERSTSADLGLSDEKAQELVEAMYKARKGVEAKYDGFDPGRLFNDAEQIDRLIEVQDAYIESARSVLSESEAAQFEVKINEFKENLKNTPRDSQ